NGWMSGPNDELLFWVPPELRNGLLLPHVICIMGQCIKTRINFDFFVHGTSWTRCIDANMMIKRE
ncbi:hypothetical protein CPB86DRAFT_713227, partial [Serendipita vermifera]